MPYRLRSPIVEAYKVGTFPMPDWLARAVVDGSVTFVTPLHKTKDTLFVPPGHWMVFNRGHAEMLSDEVFKDIYEPVPDVEVELKTVVQDGPAQTSRRAAPALDPALAEYDPRN